MKSESLSLIWNCLKKRHAGSWLSRLPLTRNGNWCRYADWRPNLYHQIKWVSSLVAVPSDLPLPPATNQVRSFSSIQMSHTLPHTYTHTHTRIYYTTKRQSHCTEELWCESTQPFSVWIQLKLCSPLWTFVVLECATGAYPRSFFPLLREFKQLSSPTSLRLSRPPTGFPQVFSWEIGTQSTWAFTSQESTKTKNIKNVQHTCDTMWKKTLPDTGRGSCNARSNRILSCSKVQFYRVQNSGFEGT